MYEDIKMTDRLNDKCQRIMKHLLNDHPIAGFFKDPVDTSLYPTYRTIVQTPSDISTIRRRLKNKKYDKLSQWNDDVELIFSNAVKFNGKGTDPERFAKQLQIAFEKLKAEYLYDVESLTKKCIKLQTKLEKLLTPDGTAVPQLPAFVEAAKSRPSKNKFDSNNYSGIESKNPSALSKLQDELEKMVLSSQYSYQILSILQEDDPSQYAGENEIDVDIEKLKPSTLKKLSDFVVANQP